MSAEPKVTVENITPAKAQLMLHGNMDNRRIRQRRVELYARQMISGQWQMAGDPVRIDPNGRLLDGQHRLLAVVAANVTVPMVVIRDLPTEAFKVIDSGMMRGFADALGAGITGGTNKAAICRLMFVYELEGDPRKSEDMALVTRTDVHDYYHSHVDEIEAAYHASIRIRSALATANATAWGATHLVAYRTDPVAAEEFVEGVATGHMLSRGDPRLALRNWISNQRTGSHTFANAGWYFALNLKAWNSYMLGESRQVISIKPDEEFPLTVKARRVRRRSAAYQERMKNEVLAGRAAEEAEAG